MKITKINSLPQAIKQKRVAAYVRVSNDKDAMRHSMSAQISYYNNYISKRIEWSFAGIYADDPVSGTKDNRIEFQRMISDCRTGKIDMIIAKSITRFARNTLTTLEVVRELKVLGIDVFFEKENIHSISGDGELLLSILASYAQEESRSVSENCKWRIKRMFEAGRSNSCTMLGYRLQDSKFYIVPEEAAIVKQIYEDYLSGMGPVAIAKKLFFAGTPTRKGGTWSKSSIAHILTNEKYMGDMILQKTFSQDHISKRKRINQGELPKYYVQNSHEAIIPKEMFERVQQEIKRRSKKPLSPDYTNPTYPFSNIIICEKCGKHYIHRSTALGTKGGIQLHTL